MIMKTLILYATKYGAAREIAGRIATRIDGAVIHDLKKGGAPPPLTEFDCIIIGSSVYAGTIHKEVKAFLGQHADTLREKKLGLFICGMDPTREKAEFESNFSPDILQAAKAASYLGGIFDPKKAGAIERFLLKKIAKISEYTNIINDDKIEQFVEIMK